MCDVVDEGLGVELPNGGTAVFPATSTGVIVAFPRRSSGQRGALSPCWLSLADGTFGNMRALRLGYRPTPSNLR